MLLDKIQAIAEELVGFDCCVESLITQFLVEDSTPLVDDLQFLNQAVFWLEARP